MVVIACRVAYSLSTFFLPFLHFARNILPIGDAVLFELLEQCCCCFQHLMTLFVIFAFPFLALLFALFFEGFLFFTGFSGGAEASIFTEMA